ncbi:MULTISPECIES: DUF983 domain-containing protein [Sphingomonadales]|uniref:DUF983 domain-containing protein n=2 Tax=Edaphosphingomonas TaxID=3423724 RepID=A0A2T4I4A9_9SPHN|nr:MULTISPECIES: DUF983 domain-containing protein [Sphingomonas]AGH50574.1 hypothetical protein G432_14275 [Sphingomonas sp. MM-1]MDX3883758.1 DUF983 domain-containing protein [Sphingomonas sp.]OHT19004.1 hypothetical protein BHE75_00984 [Sphingomonas haloaromaticamans]PTD24228.1 DUF983 domain-containing protein [Sphingomonas fennica]
MTSPTPLESGLRGLCPRCGAKTLFAGAASFAPSCRACGLSFASFNVGDGPAAFLTLGVGAAVTAMAILFELAVHPPFWLHLILWIPITAGAVLGSLRVAKGMLLALEYRNAAREGRIVEEAARDEQP